MMDRVVELSIKTEEADSEQQTSSKLRGLLNAAEDAPPVAAVEVVARRLLNSMGATEVIFRIADLSGECLVAITRVSVSTTDEDGAPADTVLIHDSHAGIALRRQRTQIVPEGNAVRVFAPVTARGDAIGVLELQLNRRPSQGVLDEVNATAHALAYVVVTNRRYTDLYEWGQRSRPMTLAAEIQRRLIPGSFTCEAGWFTVAGWLEPSTNVAGDTFDYSFDESNLSLSMTDAMGHSVDSALLATMAVAALRNARQAGNDLKGRANAANDALMAYSTNDQFVTGLIVNIPLNGSSATFVNAGHPSPFLVRDGVVTVVPVLADLPFGMFADVDYQIQTLNLQIGDRLVLVTDGLLERNAADFDILSAIGDLANLHPRELVRQLCREVTAASGGALEDDATVLCFDWNARSDLGRQSTSGSDDLGASK